MTQPGKRRRDGVVDAPDFDGLYAAQKAVKKRRRGVVRPPSLEELQIPEHHAVVAGNVGGACDDNNNQSSRSPVFEGEGEITNGHERVKEEATRTSHSSSTSSEVDQSKPSLLSPSAVPESEDNKDDKERAEPPEDKDKEEETQNDS